MKAINNYLNIGIVPVKILIKSNIQVQLLNNEIDIESLYHKYFKLLGDR